MNGIRWFDVAMFILPYALAFGIGCAIGFMCRNGRIDSLQANVRRLTAELNGEKIRTSRTEPPSRVRLVQPRTAPVRTGRPLYGPEHTADRTEPLPSGVRYVASAEESTDRPVSDQEYADMVRMQAEN